MIIPRDKIWTQNNKSDIFGTLWSSFNLDLTSNRGKVLVSPRTIITTDDITDLGVAVAFRTWTDDNAGQQFFWAVAGSYVFRVATTDGYNKALAKDISSGFPTTCDSDYSDMENWGKTYLFVSVTNDVLRLDTSTSTWTSFTGTPLTAGTTHMMCRYGNLMYVTDNNLTVRSWTPSDPSTAPASSGSGFLNLANQGFPINIITTIRSVSDGIWVFTLNQSNDGCMAFKWDGSKANDPNTAYVIPDASGLLAAVIKDDTPWVIDNNGELRVFNGGTFVRTKEVGLAEGQLPISNVKLLKNSLSGGNNRWIHPNGIAIVDGKIRILVNNEYNDNGQTIDARFNSGVWEYDPQAGWYHVQSLANYAGAIVDYGQIRVSRVGALYAAKDDSATATANGTMLIGAQIYSDATTTKEAIFTDDANDTLQKFGYLITQEIFTENIDDVWQEIAVRFRKLQSANNKIWIKYRTNKDDPTEATITWVDTNTCTTTTDVRGYVGYEMEVIQGDGSGKSAQITSVSTGPTFTVELNETFTGATTNTAKARFTQWIEAGSATAQDIQHLRLSIDEPAATKIQLKVCMQFQGEDELHDIFLNSAANQK